MNRINSPGELWKQLQEGAGLEVWRGRKKDVPGRDADVETSVKWQLGLGGNPRTLDTCLAADASSASPRITTELLLVAILTSQRGFGDMMKDMLELLTEANASRDSNVLDVEFLFETVDGPIRLTLEQFRATVERVQRVLISKYELPSQAVRWQLARELQNQAADCLPLSEASRSRQPGFPDIVPPMYSGHDELDTSISRVLEILNEFLAICVSFGPTRRAASEAATEAPENIKRAIGDATDYWDLSVLDAVQTIVHGVSTQSLNPDVVTSRLKPILASIERKTEWVDNTVQQLLDLLRLPTWNKRHELFSVWTGSVLLRTAKAESDVFHFHARDGALSFAFGGNRLASYEYGGEQFDIWAELRSDLVVKSRKRKKGIQPDFRVVRSSLGDHNKATRLVLECKHYLVPSNSNFSDAASDYARNCPNACVIVANHGPINEAALMALVDSSIHDRTSFLGDVTVADERTTNRLGSVIRQRLFPSIAKPHDSASPAVLASILLQWDDSLQDMDLGLQFKHNEMIHRIDFNNLGLLESFPNARLDRDQQQGPGEERIDISKWHSERYLVYAKNYTGVGQAWLRSLTCTIRIGGGPDKLVMCRGLGPHDTWDIAAIEIKNGKATLRIPDENLS